MTGTPLHCSCNNQKHLFGAIQWSHGHYVIRYTFTASSHIYYIKNLIKWTSLKVTEKYPVGQYWSIQWVKFTKIQLKFLGSNEKSMSMHTYVCEFVRILQLVCGCVDGSWEADTVQENHPLATDLFSRWQFQSNSHPASQWSWPPNITSSSSGLPQLVTQESRKVTFILIDAHMHMHTQVVLSFLISYSFKSKTYHTHQFGPVLDCSLVPRVCNRAVEGMIGR